MINFETKKEPKMKIFDFGAFQIKMHIQHMLIPARMTAINLGTGTRASKVQNGQDVDVLRRPGGKMK